MEALKPLSDALNYENPLQAIVDSLTAKKIELEVKLE
jgi:hypothetical protein